MACGQTKATNPMTAGIATSIKDIIFPPERFFGSMWLQPASFAGSKPDDEQETCNKRQNSGAWDTAPHARSCDIRSEDRVGSDADHPVAFCQSAFSRCRHLQPRHSSGLFKCLVRITLTRRRLIYSNPT